MGNIPVHFNCLCPPKDDEKNEINDLQTRVNNIHAKVEIHKDKLTKMEMQTEKINKIEIQNEKLTKMENKIDRIEDKIEMKFELLFLNMKIKNK